MQILYAEFCDLVIGIIARQQQPHRTHNSQGLPPCRTAQHTSTLASFELEPMPSPQGQVHRRSTALNLGSVRAVS